MISRLLRGRMIYILLGLLIVGLYAHALKTGHGQLHGQLKEQESAVRPEAAEAAYNVMDILPEPVDSTTMLRLSKEKPVVAFVASFASLLTTIILALGSVISVWGILSGRLKSVWHFPQARLTVWSLHEAGRIVLLVLMIAGLMPFVRLALLSIEPSWELDTRLWAPISMVLLDGFVILSILAFAEGKRKSGGWDAVGFVRKADQRSIRVGVVSYITLFPWLLLLLYLTVALANHLQFKPPAEPIQELIFKENRSWVFMITVLLACVIGPIAEECFFRGVLYPAFRQKTSRWAAMLITGCLFGAIHTNIIGFLPIAFLGCLLAYIYERTGSLTGSLLVHMVHNSLLMGSAILYRYVAPS